MTTTRISHTDCDHESTSKARAICRRERAFLHVDPYVAGAPVMRDGMYATIAHELAPKRKGRNVVARRFKIYTPEGEGYTVLETELELV
jgi:hypothetical protein